MRRVKRPLLLTLASVVFLALVAGSFVLGRTTAPPTRAAIEDAQEPISVYADVEIRVVDSRQSFTGTVQPGTVYELKLPAGASGVVVRQSVGVGDSVAGGTLLAVVSGLPYFALQAPLPLYRELSRGDTGDDVMALQNALNAAGLDAGTSGRVDARMLAAAARLYRNAGFEFDTRGPIPYQQLIAIDGSRVVVAAVPVGGDVGGDASLVTVQLSDPFVSFVVDPVAAADIEMGDVFAVADGDSEIAMAVKSIGAYVPPGDGSEGGQTIQLVAETPPAKGLTIGRLMTVRGDGVDEPALAVPVVAVRDDGEGPYVLRHAEGKEEEDQRVPIAILRNGNGWAAIADGGLRAGDQVLVSW